MLLKFFGVPADHGRPGDGVLETLCRAAVELADGIENVNVDPAVGQDPDLMGFQIETLSSLKLPLLKANEHRTGKSQLGPVGALEAEGLFIAALDQAIADPDPVPLGLEAVRGYADYLIFSPALVHIQIARFLVLPVIEHDLLVAAVLLQPGAEEALEGDLAAGLDLPR